MTYLEAAHTQSWSFFPFSTKVPLEESCGFDLSCIKKVELERRTCHHVVERWERKAKQLENREVELETCGSSLM